MKLSSTLIGLFGALLMLLSLSAHAATPAQSAPAADPCELLKTEDVSALLGGKPKTKSNNTTCIWTVDGSKFQIHLMQYEAGMTSDMNYDTIKMKSRKAKKAIIDEPGLGDKAFALMEGFGVSLAVIKKGRLLVIQYGGGVPGTNKELDAIMPLAKKAVEAF